MEKEMATHSSILAWRIPTEEAGGLKSMGSQRVGQDWATACTRCKKTFGHHYTPVRMTKIQNSDNIKCWQECGATEILTDCWWEWKMVPPLWKTSLVVPQKVSHIIQQVCLTYPGVHTNTCAWVFTAALLKMEKTQMSINGQIDKMWYTLIHTEHYLSININ